MQTKNASTTTKSHRLSVGRRRQALSPAKADRLSERGPGEKPNHKLANHSLQNGLAAHAGAGNDRFRDDPDVAHANSQAASLDCRWENVHVDVCKCHRPRWSNETENRNKSGKKSGAEALIL